MLYGPMAVMLAVTMTALIQQLVKIAQAIASGNFVFMVHGLQGILAVALIVLAVLVVYHSVLKLREPARGAKEEAAV